MRTLARIVMRFLHEKSSHTQVKRNWVHEQARANLPMGWLTWRSHQGGVTRRRATRWTKEAQTKRWIKWTKFAIGFKDVEMINDHKVIDEGQLGRFSDKEAAVA
jgi:hypothetical protein